MKRINKIVIGELKEKRNVENNLPEYFKLLSTALLKYSVIKLSMNYFTMEEMIEDANEEKGKDVKAYFDRVSEVLKNTVAEKQEINESMINEVKSIRDTVTEKMKILTSYTDALEIYEYILNRREAEVKGNVEEFIDTDMLADMMFGYVFSDKNKVIINSKIQSLVAQLPVRMTKGRFYDILSATLALYKGSDKSSADDFVEMIEDAALLRTPEKFESEYENLYETYQNLKDTDYKNLGSVQYEFLNTELREASDFINERVTDYLMLQEVINDVLVVLFTKNTADMEHMGNAYDSAVIILDKIISADDIYKASEDFDDLFMSLEGAQEDAYEDVVDLEKELEEIVDIYKSELKDMDLYDTAKKLRAADLLLSSSLFMNIDNDNLTGEETADSEYIKALKEKLISEFDEVFKEVGRFEKRSIMAKVLSQIPVFFNSQAEIRDYFEYSLSRCGDDSELTACAGIIEDIISEE